MKNSIMTLLAVAFLVSCNKKETTPNDTSMDSTASPEMVDTTGMVGDSESVSSTATSSSALSDKDKMFVDAAAKGGMMEVMMGELAANNASNPTVKSLGMMIAQDHKKANDELKAWATSVNYMLPTSMDADQQKKHDELKAKKGADFDKAYTMMMVEDHKKDVAAFKKEASEGSDASVKGFAEKTLPTLENHLKESEKAWAAVK
ncbi:DUF4142 domain-containing protein [Chryseobacterium sp.]|uniref:DUF4142 domain-containing protein n=1 Tax=Chryseobacterium sp. TaxID=1871047 RepID=UPI0028A0469C|nr:DUF4142 domain-containing protein [Chryseobacterium sp.]